ncbi:BlaI/MecI/CopY family transcriptional regulator [Pyxidicoccus parkwayensis]|jgi:BlaI family transcriptional regulator, penicillinase repressor|uniref:BlaI/MecI/CopY family transcriptional regulator n=1 Tax=Pyxidicoccus parkwayensis TaxID=2813578 RepID=A0ABX7P4U3_9BACT|nr:BlaI/MecI/CopY family transcriptional regulator [Pyxidicoccus parkwaysis]QSQ25457.1 BlaI/MecI/CopY family transcriptional regulator [Pyxidicoccus parkwaysis]
MTPALPQPTRAELAILRVLWKLGPCTVRQVHESLRDTQDTGYTTVLKLLQNMTEKGLVQRDESERTHVYDAALSEKRTQRDLLKDLMDRAFGGSATTLVAQALSMKRTSAEELAEIRRLLDEHEKRGK